MKAFGLLRSDRRGVAIAVDSREDFVRIAGGEVIRGRPQNKCFTVDERLDRERYGARKQRNLGVRNTTCRVQIVESENRVLSQVERRSVF